WTGRLRGQFLDAYFERGFIHRITVDAAVFPEHAEALFEAEPIRAVRLVRPNPRYAEFEVLLAPCFDVKGLRHVTSLDVQGVELLQTDCEKMEESPSLAGLTSLSLRGNPIFPHWIRGMLASDVWPNLTRLNLSQIANLGPALALGLRDADHRRFKSL